MPERAYQDAQIFKERCEDSPGVVILCQGDWRPTPERLGFFEKHNYYVLTAANGFQDIVDWLPQPRCIGAMFGHPGTVAQARAAFPDKVIERFEGVGARFLRNISQETPYNLHNAGLPFTATVPRALRTLDVVSVFSPVPLKRGELLLESLIDSNASAYLFAHSFGGDPKQFENLLALVKAAGKSIEYFHLPFDPYALIRIDGRIVIDGRPIGANSSIVSSYLGRCRLFVHTSTTEGISNAIMEALISDVPVLLCDDIRGPQQELSQQLPKCIFRTPPDKQALTDSIRRLLAHDHIDGAISSSFRAIIDPYEINRTMVLGVQKWFARHGLPWKGHCLGLLGGVQSKLDFANLTAEESYRGHRHIYGGFVSPLNCVAIQHEIARNAGIRDYARSLEAEHGTIAVMADGNRQDYAIRKITDDDAGLTRFVRTFAAWPELKHALIIGELPEEVLTALIKTLAGNLSAPRLHCLQSSANAHRQFSELLKKVPFADCHHASSVPLAEFPPESDVIDYYRQTPDKLSDYPLGQVLGWFRADIAEMQTPEKIGEDGIGNILQTIGQPIFDAVIINGREFTGHAELKRLIGAPIILLGCTRTYKNRASLLALLKNEDYELVLSAANIGNGYAGFVSRQAIGKLALNGRPPA
ncbi:glycosyltransferase [Propionivibrio dicarboxylicus]|uniref:Glycosyl transferases group 1 n=1 Tax=Propionivibrio dicarboxylicus TaxID=83767 RepID=A0A1G8H9P8_9RHOO|nr:glycosyltransferase [Propionivibrio dicarboxylicus]SDI03353.1 Glycosyl transferases group 1 [Propionivibrio dicarboxylicus]